MEAIDVIKNLSSACLIIIVSLCYCYFISSKLPKGIFRLISLIPIFCIFTILPFHLCSAFATFATFATSLSITWLCNFKLLLFAFDQGPLSWKRSKPSLLIFITIAALPIKIKENKYPPANIKSPLNLVVEALLFALVTEILIHYRVTLSTKWLSLLLLLGCSGIFTFFLVEILLGCSCWIGKSLTGLELDKPSNDPYLSTSVQDFWGRRWNLTVSNTLRHTIYFPVRTASEKVIGKGLCSTCLGVLAAFVVSGLMHELLYYQMTLAATTLQVTLYYVLHGVVVSTEIVLKKKFKDKLRLPWFFSGPLTFWFVIITTWRFHFAELIRTGVDARFLEEFHLCVEYLKTKILDLPSVPGVNLS